MEKARQYHGKRKGMIFLKRIICAFAVMMLLGIFCLYAPKHTLILTEMTESGEEETENPNGATGQEVICQEEECMERYLPLLEEYEHAWKDESYTKEKWNMIDENDWVFSDSRFIRFRHDRKYTLHYWFMDLTDDGTPELIVGVRYTEEQDVLVSAIYTCEDGEVTAVYCRDADWVNLYEGGILETKYWIRPEEGITYIYDYYQLQQNSAQKDILAELGQRYIYSENGEERQEYFQTDWQGEERSTPCSQEITEKDFMGILSRYTATGLMEPDWTPLDGFWVDDKQQEE